MSDNSEVSSTGVNIGRIVALFGGVILITSGVRFTYFGLLLATIMPVTGVILAIVGMLSGVGVLLGILTYPRWNVTSIVLIIISSIWGIFVSTGIFLGPILGVGGGIILLLSKRMSIGKRKLITLFLTILILILPLLGIIRSQSEDFQYIMVGDTKRQYLIHIPESYNGSDAVPLLLALHGGGGSAKSMRNANGFDAVADKYNFILVYPDGTGDMSYQFHTWNSGYIDAYAFKNNIDDVLFLSTLIDELLDTYNVNKSRVYMTGHSNGAMMTYRFGAEHPDSLAAIAPVSGSIGGRMSEESNLYVIPSPSEPLSVIHIHGRLDEQVLYEGGKGEKGFLTDRVDLSVNDSIQFWINHNNCSNSPSLEKSDNERIELARFGSGEKNTEVALITLLYGSHAWSNMSAEIALEEFYATSLAELIWIQVSQYSRV
ncbi:MAG: conserved membrane protein of unknown function [Candidatus Thorarchaeota archaeon]|nr:MAG: conserved membrane protein of unknown function [Candidatus Thorarchaeota archaeon]